VVVTVPFGNKLVILIYVKLLNVLFPSGRIIVTVVDA